MISVLQIELQLKCQEALIKAHAVNRNIEAAEEVSLEATLNPDLLGHLLEQPFTLQGIIRIGCIVPQQFTSFIILTQSVLRG